MLKSVWLWIFIGSMISLVYLAVRHRIGRGWVSAIALHLVVAGILLYFAGLAEPYTHIHVPLNMVTIVTVAALGAPGLALLFGLKFVLF